MKVLSVRDNIRSVSGRFNERYKSEKVLQKAQLYALNVETATPDNVAAIMGTTAWIDIFCGECNRSVDSVVQFGEFNYDSTPEIICLDCLKNAVGLLESRE